MQKKAIELGFADHILFAGEKEGRPKTEAVLFRKMVAVNSLLGKLPRGKRAQGTDISIFEKRLNLLKHQGGM